MLVLPASEEELTAAQEQLGTLNWENTVVLDYDGILPNAAFFADLPMELEAFNELAAAVRDISSPEKQLPKLKALLEQFEVRDIATAISLTEHLEDYSVVFVAEDGSGDPRVAMYRFFEMWGQIQISAKMLNRFYYDFAAEVGNIQRSIGIKVSDLKKDTYAANEEMIKEKIHTVFDRFKDDLYFQFIYGADYESYFSKPGVTKAKDCLKDNTAYSILSAYKLFYVGCSRARRNLTILLDSSKIKGNLELQKKRFEEIGFEVMASPMH